MKQLILPFFLVLFINNSHAQMWNGQDTLYGNEWINYANTYFKIKVAEDGLYRIDFQLLSSSGFPISSVLGNQLRLYRYGKQEPVFTSTDNLFATQDFLEFYGEKNRGQVDQYLFENVEQEQINPRYSMFNDTAVYYLTWENTGQALRFNDEPNNLNNLPAKTAFCWSTVEQLPASGAFKKRISDEVTFSWFDGVGYTSSSSVSENVIPFTLPGIVANAPDARVQVRYAANLGEHQKKILLNDTLYAEDVFEDFKLVSRSFSVLTSRLSATTNLKITSPIADRHGLAYATIRYARDFEFSNGTSVSFELDSSEQYLEIQGFNVSGDAPVLYDLNNNQRFVVVVDGTLLKAKLPASSKPKRIILVNAGSMKSVPSLPTVHFQPLNDVSANYLIISNSALFKDPKAGGVNRVAEYATYRASAAGGNHDVAVVDVEDLYAQFAYGVRFHPIAIRNFLHWAKKVWPETKHALIIGKALDFNAFRTSAQQSTLIDSLFFVPNFSTPGADLPFTMSGNHLSDPIVAIGRLAVTKPEEIHDYLQKVIEHEQQLLLAEQNIPAKAWMKRVIHNSGGLSGETVTIRNFINSMANTLKSNRFGADVHTFYKTSDDPIQLSAYEQLLDLINGGISVWTIFGHSSAFAVDFDIGLPTSYNNQGRYPLMLVMGCFSGICSSPQQGIGEQFVLSPNRGAIAYIASVNYSYIDALSVYGQQYYENMGGADYGNTVGLTLAHTINALKNTSSNGLIAVLHQNLLQGDPAMRVHAHQGPDYVIDNQTVKVDPNPVSINENTLDFSFDVVNLGENTRDSLPLTIEQRLPDNATLLSRLADTVEAPGFRRNYTFQLPVSGSKIGFNRFLLNLDPGNVITENPMSAENNNSLLDASGVPGKEVFFYADDVAQVFPPPYAIVGKQAPTLFASTLNTSAATFRYLFELDTVETFNSPIKISTQITQKGGLIAWKLANPLMDSVVYYWRVARDSLVNGAPLWRQRSFIYLPGSPAGWNQSHFGQFKDDAFINLKPVDSLRTIQFQDNAAFVNVQVAFRGVNRYPGFKNAYYQGFYGDFGWNQQNIIRGVSMMVVDPNSGRAVINPANGPYNYAPQKDREFFWFDTRDSLERKKMMDFVENAIPDGYYVGLLAFNRTTDAVGYAPQLWAKDSISQGKNLFQLLESQGAKHVRELTNFSTVPPAYGFVFRKNHPEFENLDTVVTNVDATVEIRANFLGKWALGSFETPIIGPVKKWKSIHWGRGSFDNSSDKATLSIIAVREGLEDSLLLTLHKEFDATLKQVPANLFPRLKLRYDLADTLTRTVTPIHFARIIYDGIPEGALHPVAQFSFYSDTLEQGETFRSSVAFANISDAPFDSLLLRLKIENQLNNGFELQKRLRPLLPGDTVIAEFSAKTKLLAGPQRLVLEANPAGDQEEQYHFNNVLLHDFFVRRDVRNPLLDVTFDGQHILDGDLIAPSPIVTVSLKDENRFLAMRDSNTLSLRLILPDGSQQTISTDDPSVAFYPADVTNLPKKNLARLEWRPTFTVDGEYRLLVNGTDASGNESADLDWSVTFKIITKSSLSNILNYPNPFSTSTCFVYTLTGNESPTHFKIQIMTVGGRVVREITEQEFGPLKPGTHRSEFYWNGKDEYGDQLANGVYLYRIVAKKADGSDFENFENQSVDGMFKHGFGKMVLMR